MAGHMKAGKMIKALIGIFAGFVLIAIAEPVLADLTLNNVTAAYFVVNSNPSPSDIDVKVNNDYNRRYSLQYNSGAGWFVLPSGNSKFTVSKVVDRQLVLFQLVRNSTAYTIADMTFSQKKQSSSTPLYRKVEIDFDGICVDSEVMFKSQDGPHFYPCPCPTRLGFLPQGFSDLSACGEGS